MSSFLRAFLSLVITILNDAFILTGHEGLLQQGLRMLLGSGVTVKSTSTSLTLLQQPLISFVCQST